MTTDSKRLFLKFMEAGIPTLITGKPGTGKTGFVKSLEGMTMMGKPIKVLPLAASVREPADIGGYPVPDYDKGIVSLMPVNWAYSAKEYVESGHFVIIFADELRTVTAPVQAALMKAVHERQVGDMTMPFEVRWGSAANTVEESAGGVPLEAPMANRWAHIPKWVPNYKEWCADMTLNKYALQSPLGTEALERLPQERALIASFIAKSPGSLLNVPKDEEKRDGPWPSPRTLDYTAHAWATAGKEDFDLREQMMAACVGLDIAAMFIQWQKASDLPDPEDVLDGKYTSKQLVDATRPDRTYAIFNAIVAAVGAKWTDKRYLAAWKVLGEASTAENIGDVAAAMVPNLLRTAEGKDNVPNIGRYVQPFIDLLKRAGWAPGL
jgi:hypothetical protein